MCINDKITTVPRLFSEHSKMKSIKHQIMNVHTKWNCLMPILSIVRLNIAVSGMNNCLAARLETRGGAGNSGACMLTPRVYACVEYCAPFQF